MPIEWRDEHWQRRQKAMAKNVYSRRLYLTADKAQVVEEGDERAAFLLGGAGSPVDEADVERYGLTEKHFRAADTPTEESPSIVISGGVTTGPGLVKGEAGDAQADAVDADTPKGSRKGAKK